MRSLRTMPQDELIRLEGRVEEALEALERLEALAAALERRDLVWVATHPLPNLGAFDELESIEAERFRSLAKHLDEQLTTLSVSEAPLADRVRALLAMPVIVFPGQRWLVSVERTERWLWRGPTAVNLEVCQVERTSFEACSVGGVPFTTNELRLHDVPVPNYRWWPRPKPPPTAQLPETVSREPTVHLFPPPRRMSTSTNLSWTIFFIVAGVVSLSALCLVMKLGI